MWTCYFKTPARLKFRCRVWGMLVRVVVYFAARRVSDSRRPERGREWGLYQMHGNVWEWTRDTNESYTERWKRVSKALRKFEVIDLEGLLSGLSVDEWAVVEELHFVPTAG